MVSPPSAAPDAFEFQALQNAANYRRAILHEFSPWLRGRVLEVGAGVGQLTAELLAQPAIKELLALEPDPSFCEALKRLAPAAQRGYTVREGTAEGLAGPRAWDAVVSVNVLEHIADDAAELARYQELLAPGGALCLFVPARPELYARIDQLFGHYRRYTRPELAGKLRAAGFQVSRLFYFNLAGYFAWWLNFRLLGATRFNPRAVSFYDAIIFRAGNFFESRLLRPPFGQSLLAIAEPRNTREGDG